MKKTAVFLILLIANASYAVTSEVFDGMDTNAVKAALSKFILTRGGKVNHGESYDLNTFSATEQLYKNRVLYNYVYLFNLVPLDNATRLDLIVSKGLVGEKPLNVSANEEKETMEVFKGAMRGRYLYGLGFDFDYYDSPNGKIKAPKGKNTGIKITLARYDAQKQGIKAGDIIVAINKTDLKNIPLKEYSTVLFAQKMSDSVTLTIKRGHKTFDVTLKPRLSNNRVF